jgi:hypothetical protein
MVTFKAIDTLEEWQWAHGIIKMIVDQSSQGIMAYENGNRVAACVADEFGIHSCCVHLAITKPVVLKHGFLQEIARHLFITCNLKRLFGKVPSDNTRALKLNKHLGWREVARVPDGVSDGVDMVVMRMDRDTCRWLDKLQEAA